MSRVKRTAKEEHAQKLKEAFAILTQGVEMMHYNASEPTDKSRLKKIVWMDSDILRLCVAVARPTLADRAKGKVPPGVYMRDIAEVRRGSVSYHFKKNPNPPSSDEHCLSLIATEGTLSLELPSKFARDWFFERLQLVADDILTSDEREERAARRIEAPGRPMSPTESEISHQLGQLLARGVQVMHHHPMGRIFRSVLSADSEVSVLTMQTLERTFFGYAVVKPMQLSLTDVVEIRIGTHSFGFVGTRSTDKHNDCMSLIGSQCTLDFQLSNENSRDLFAARLRTLLLHVQAMSGSGTVSNI